MIPKSWRVPVAAGLASGLTYGSVVLLDSLARGPTVSEALKSAALQFVLSMLKTAATTGVVRELQAARRTLSGKLLVTYAPLPISLAIYGVSHAIARTPALAPKLALMGGVMLTYYTVLLVVHLREQPSALRVVRLDAERWATRLSALASRPPRSTLPSMGVLMGSLERRCIHISVISSPPSGSSRRRIKPPRPSGSHNSRDQRDAAHRSSSVSCASTKRGRSPYADFGQPLE
ncbi:MAG: hypothetical protein IT379_39700 [Deltaproteobacteria bacterium]|nr:hypothetical protein [Deltaproteobacteria bacterium]